MTFILAIFLDAYLALYLASRAARKTSGLSEICIQSSDESPLLTKLAVWFSGHRYCVRRSGLVIWLGRQREGHMASNLDFDKKGRGIGKTHRPGDRTDALDSVGKSWPIWLSG